MQIAPTFSSTFPSTFPSTFVNLSNPFHFFRIGFKELLPFPAVSGCFSIFSKPSCTKLADKEMESVRLLAETLMAFSRSSSSWFHVRQRNVAPKWWLGGSYCWYHEKKLDIHGCPIWWSDDLWKKSRFRHVFVVFCRVIDDFGASLRPLRCSSATPRDYPSSSRSWEMDTAHGTTS